MLVIVLVIFNYSKFARFDLLPKFRTVLWYPIALVLIVSYGPFSAGLTLKNAQTQKQNKNTNETPTVPRPKSCG